MVSRAGHYKGNPSCENIFMVKRGVFLLFLVVVLSVPAFCQFAAVIGRVVDSTGAVLPDVKITARNSATSTVISTMTNAEGYFALSNLPVGGYTLQAEKAGFNKEQTADIKLQVGQTAPHRPDSSSGRSPDKRRSPRCVSRHSIGNFFRGRGRRVSADSGSAS